MREFIQKDLWLKIFSLVLAALIWFVLQPNLQSDAKYPQNPFRPVQQTREFECRVTLLMSPEDRKLYRIEPETVAVRVQGDASTLAGFEPEDVQVYVNLATLNDPQGGVRVEAILPREVSLRSIIPAHVYVTNAVPSP